VAASASSGAGLAIGKHLRAGDMAFLDVKMQLHAAPGKTLIQQMGKAGA
jgi:hypothetical protein